MTSARFPGSPLLAATMDLRLELLSVGGRRVRAARALAPGSRAVLGRDGVPDVTVSLADEEVCRRHCLLESRLVRRGHGAEVGSEWWLRDLGSRSGVLLNDVPVSDPVRVRAGDLLRLGRSKLLVELGTALENAICRGCLRRAGAPGPGLSHGRRWVCEACLGGERRSVRRLGGWVEVAERGQGSYGRVVLAAAEGGERLAALKIADLDPFGDTEIERENEARFRRETRTLRDLDHPSIVRVYDAGSEDDTRWVALELMETDLLRVVRTHGHLKPRQVASIGAELLEGLAHVHARGVLHRDLKPENVFLGVDGAVRLGDFGLCSAPGATRITATRLGMGTLHYASPEQLEDAHAVDPRTDLYGWGATLYYLLTARSPFWWAKGYPEVLAAVLQEETPRADRLDPEIPFGLAVVVERAMAREPERRFADAREALEALARVRV